MEFPKRDSNMNKLSPLFEVMSPQKEVIKITSSAVRRIRVLFELDFCCDFDDLCDLYRLVRGRNGFSEIRLYSKKGRLKCEIFLASIDQSLEFI